jgi:hypothetical protein
MRHQRHDTHRAPCAAPAWPALALVACAGCAARAAAPWESAPASLAAPDADNSGDGAVQAACAPPQSTRYCYDEGCTLPPLVLHQCDAAESPWPVYNPALCATDATVIEIVATWCRTCQLLAPMLQQDIVERYGGRVVLVSVLMQNPDYSPPTAAFCQRWQSMYGLTGPVVIDPAERTLALHINGVFPTRVLLDRRGTIRYRAYGTGVGLPELQSAIDAVLAEP